MLVQVILRTAEFPQSLLISSGHLNSDRQILFCIAIFRSQKYTGLISYKLSVVNTSKPPLNCL